MNWNHGEYGFKLLDNRQCSSEFLYVALKLGNERRRVDIRPEVLVFPEADPAEDIASRRTIAYVALTASQPLLLRTPAS